MAEHCAGAVVSLRSGPDPAFLLILDGHGNWGFPKGHVENGETVLQAAVREVSEETGITDPENLGHLGRWTWEFAGPEGQVQKVCDFFLFGVQVSTVVPQESEGISEIVWLSFEQAEARLTFDTSREALSAAHATLTSPRSAD